MNKQLQLISQDKQMRMQYEAREKAMRDHNEMMYEAEERGRKNEALNIATNLISLGADMDIVIKATRLPVDLVEKMYKNKR